MPRRNDSALLVLLCALLPTPLLAQTSQPTGTLLLRQPSLSDEHLAFVYAGDIWIADRDGGHPRRLTTDPADERRPHFSPDGQLIAYTADYGGNTDVYVIPVAGGEPHRLTYHPGADEVTGWSPDGKHVTFSSAREVGNGRSGQLWEAGLNGGLPTRLMKAPFFRGVLHGRELAYMAYGPAYNGLYGGTSGWRGYRGGMTPFIRILDLDSGRIERIPGQRVNDIEPMWDGDTLYFISDRDDKVFNVFRYDRQTGSAEPLTHEDVWDVRSADVHHGVVVYEAGGRLKTLDTANGQSQALAIFLPADLPETRPRWEDASDDIESVQASTSGKRALITARGEVFTVPTEHGSTRNLTQTDGRREYTALWSPDGKHIAYVIDDQGDQSLAVVDQAGLERPRTYPLGHDFHSLLDWGGDGSRVVFSDNHLNLYLLRLADGRVRKIATSDYRADVDVATSPDGRWIAFTAAGPNLLKDLKLYDTASGRTTRLSDGMADVSEVAFSPDGKYLYFGASTNAGPSQERLDLSSQEKPRRLALYALVLSADGVSPLAPRTGAEGGAGKHGEDESSKRGGKDEAKVDGDEEQPETPPVSRVDLQGIDQRVVAIPVPASNYTDLNVARDGDLFYVDQVQPGAMVAPADAPAESADRLMRFAFDDREAKKIADGITAVTLSHDGKRLLARNAQGDWLYADIKDDMKVDDELDTSGMRMRVDPRREWAQIFYDAWRMERQFFYAPNMHGLDWQAIYDRYRPLLDYAGRREDVNDLIVQMIAELGVSHNRAGGGDVYQPNGEPRTGLLGADLRIDHGRYRIQKIYTGERWNPFLHAPLARPELEVHAGDYILAVNGRELTGNDNVFQFLQGTVDEQTDLTVSATPSMADARTVVVEPTDDERALRLWDWVETNRRIVAKATDGRVGYVYLPDTAGGGYTMFNRMFFAQADKPALIVDERSNGGGQAANYIIDVLGRSYLASWKDRDGLIFDTPGGAIYGPKVMLIDQDAGSGGDFLPYAFRREHLGKLIGTRTWGGLIGISVNPPLIDGGFLTVPFFRFFTPNGHWAIENQGVAPDIPVELDPVQVNHGRDLQLERAIDEVAKELKSYRPIKQHTAPPLPTQRGQ